MLIPTNQTIPTISTNPTIQTIPTIPTTWAFSKQYTWIGKADNSRKSELRLCQAVNAPITCLTCNNSYLLNQFILTMCQGICIESCNTFSLVFTSDRKEKNNNVYLNPTNQKKLTCHCEFEILWGANISFFFKNKKSNIR